MNKYRVIVIGLADGQVWEDTVDAESAADAAEDAVLELIGDES